MRGHARVLLLIVVAAVVVAVGVYAYYLSMPRVSLLVYKDSKVTGCRERINETVILHVKNDGTVDLYINACRIEGNIGGGFSVDITYIFQSDIVIPVGVEAVISFPAGGGEVAVETLSGPPGAAASGGVYAASDSPEQNPFLLSVENQLWIYTRSGVIGGGAGHGGFPINFTP